MDPSPPAASESVDRLPFRLNRRPEERIRLLGQTMDLVKPEEVLHFISGRVRRSLGGIVANHNAHSLYLLRKNPAFQDFYRRADLVEIDSTPLLMWARITGRKKSRRFHRCTYLDWRASFWRLAVAGGWRVFYLGGAPGVADRAASAIGKQFPGVTLGVRDGYFDMTNPAACAEVLAQIRAFRPQVLLVGMGMPRQETWISENYDALDPCVVLPVGAAFDYEAGVQAAAPRWMGRLGVEWLFRLVSDPKRLFTRYCVEPWSLIQVLAYDLWDARRLSRLEQSLERRAGKAQAGSAPRRRASDQRGTLRAEDYTNGLIVSKPDHQVAA
jgi:N-acetylglucosaminyldiphosphoundecaprenol N-acetyl-beta-D-mannosaminyltransferase